MTYGTGFAGMLMSMVMTANEAALAGDRDRFRDRVPAPMAESYSFIDDYPDARIFVFATNLFDADEPIQIEPGAIASGDAAILQHPRTFGVGLEMKF